MDGADCTNIFTTSSPNLEFLSIDTISEYIIRNFKGHGLARIVEEILKAKGFAVFRSPKGADHGVDLLASSGSLGFASPKICVQVKSTEDAVERVVLDQLIGTMTNVGAEASKAPLSAISRCSFLRFAFGRVWR